jgi:hypothetical protein
LRSLCLEILGSYYSSFTQIVHCYFDEIFQYILFAISACLLTKQEYNDEDDEYEMILYQLSLAESITLCINLILVHLVNFKQQALLNPYIVKIIDFLNQITRNDDLTDKLASVVLTLYTDVVIEYKDIIYQYIDKNAVFKLYNKTSNYKEGYQIANFASKNLLHLLNN